MHIYNKRADIFKISNQKIVTEETYEIQVLNDETLFEEKTKTIYNTVKEKCHGVR